LKTATQLEESFQEDAMRVNPVAAVRTRIVTKILAIAAIAMLLTAVVGGVSAWHLRVVTDKGNDIYTQALVPTQEVGNLREAVGRVRVDGLSGVIATSQKRPDQIAMWKDALTKDEALIDEIHATYIQRDLPPAEKEAVDRFWAAWTEYRASRDLGDQLNREGRTAEWVQVRDGRTTPAIAAARTALDDLTQASAVTATQRMDQAVEAGKQAMRLTTASVLVGLLVMVFVGVVVARSIVRPLYRLRDVLLAVADGDLRPRAEIAGADEVGQMAAALNTTLTNVHGVVRQIEQDAARLSSFAGSVSARTDGFSTSDQAAAAELAVMAEDLTTIISVFGLEDTAEPATT
jgi:methyl-accepting chemotaxis protein